MGIFKKLFQPASGKKQSNESKTSKPAPKRALSHGSFDLVSAVERYETKKIVSHLKSKSEPKNPVAIPYTKEAILNDLDTLYEFQRSYKPTRDEFAAAIASKMLHLTHKSTMKWLEERTFVPPTSDHLIYIGTYLYTLDALKELSSISSKEYQISSCNDERTCAACKKHDGETYALSEAVIGKTAPPFCEKCRCIIQPVFIF